MKFRNSLATGRKSTHKKNVSSSRVRNQTPSENIMMGVKKWGPLMPVWGTRRGSKMKIKSWRVWIEFNDGDWHAETLQSLNAQQRQNILTRIKDGYEVWPWPNDGTPSDRVKVATLKQLHMKEYLDNKRWLPIPQQIKNDDDTSADLPVVRDFLFEIADGTETVTTTESEPDDSTDVNDDEEEEDEY